MIAKRLAVLHGVASSHSAARWIASSSIARVPRTDRLESFAGPTVWHEFTPLANEHKALNLGQGFPNWETPMFVKQAHCEAVMANHNQYCRSNGHPLLVEHLAREYSVAFGRAVNAMNDVVITYGATEALYAVAHALIEPGDEAVIIEPAYDSYPAVVALAGGVSRFVPLRVKNAAAVTASEKFGIDIAELKAAITPKTRMLILNTPHNPTGKVFTPNEMEELAEIVRNHPNLTVIADEVYEKIVYGMKHVHFATIPGMEDRTITISSMGKTFSCTGWKIGYASVFSENLVFCTSTPTQVACAASLQRASQPYEGFPSYYHWLVDVYTKKRTLLLDALNSAGLKPVVPDGGYFILAQTEHLPVPSAYLAHSTPACPTMTRDWALCRWLTIEGKVAAIPPSAFYSAAHKPLAAGFARFAYCKDDETLIDSKQNLTKFVAAMSAARLGK